MAFETLAIVASIGSALVGAGGTVLSGMAAKQAGDYQNKVAQMNAQIAEDNAKRALERSQIEQQDQDMLTRAQLGQQEALQAASGVTLSAGSQMLTRKAAAQLGRRDSLNIRQGGEIEAYNYKTQAVNQRAEGALAKSRGQGALIGSYFSAGGSLLSNAATIANPDRFGPRKS